MKITILRLRRDHALGLVASRTTGITVSVCADVAPFADAIAGETSVWRSPPM